MRHPWPISLVALALCLITTACTGQRAAPRPSASAPTAPTNFLTLQGGHLQIRAVKNGKVTQTANTTAQLAATYTDGVAAAIADGCRTRITTQPRIGKTTARTLITLPSRISGFAITADGTKLAYLSDSTCTVPASSGATTLTVVDLRTGKSATRKAATSAPFTGVVWGPSNAKLALAVGGTVPAFASLDATTLATKTGEEVTLPYQCGYTDPVWTGAGILAVEVCPRSAGDPLAPLRIVEINDGQGESFGTDDANWRLPACTATAHLSTDAPHTSVYVQYGAGAPTTAAHCSSPHSTVLGTLTTTDITKITTLTASSQQLDLVG